MNAVNAGFELFDHTADMGVRAWAPSMNELVAPAVAGFYSSAVSFSMSIETRPYSATSSIAGKVHAPLTIGWRGR